MSVRGRRTSSNSWGGSFTVATSDFGEVGCSLSVCSIMATIVSYSISRDLEQLMWHRGARLVLRPTACNGVPYVVEMVLPCAPRVQRLHQCVQFGSCGDHKPSRSRKTEKTKSSKSATRIKILLSRFTSSLQEGFCWEWHCIFSNPHSLCM